MFITYADIKHKLQPPLDCSKEGDLRGRSFHNCLIVNFKNTDFTGCVLYHCFPSGFADAIEIRPAQSEEDVNLRGADLQGANLYGTDLRRANLQGVDLTGVDLIWADLRGAKHNSETNFIGSNISQEQRNSMNFVEDEDD